MALAPFLVAGLVCWLMRLGSSLSRRALPGILWWLAGVYLIAFVARHAVLAIFDTSSFPTVSGVYLGPAPLLVSLFACLAIADFGERREALSPGADPSR